MKATLRLWTAVMALVCVSLQVSALPYSDSRMVQENSLLSLKRTKPSLSIVNPLDVLRQRIILEMARRQMRENTRQVELNKALLREIGKRSSNLYDGSEYPVDYTYYDRKLYNQHVASKPDHSNPTDADELEAMVESLLQHNNRLAAREGNYAGKFQRTRSVSERQTPDSRMGSNQHQGQQAQSQQLTSLFNNEQDDLKTKDQALRQSTLAGGQEPDNTEDDDQDQQEQQSMNDGSSSGVLKAIQQDGNNAPSDRTSGTDFGSHYVYGMYKNRYAN
uniref:Corticotropin-releasing factor domain-containing protein n=1 Tax=Anopheles stephensi TaxID=30069 RepID=A0A182YK76_ANOST